MPRDWALKADTRLTQKGGGREGAHILEREKGKNAVLKSRKVDGLDGLSRGRRRVKIRPGRGRKNCGRR